VDFRIAERAALVVGGKGIGFEMARMLAAEGCRVAVVARTQRNIDRAVAKMTDEGGQAVGIAADMNVEAGINGAVAAATRALGPPLIAVTGRLSRAWHVHRGDSDAGLRRFVPRDHTEPGVPAPGRCYRR